MTINSRAKGGEREFSRVLQDHLGVKLLRNLEQSRNGGHYLIVSGDDSLSRVLGKFAIEVKRYAFITPTMLARFWEQAKQRARKVKKTPVLAYRGAWQEWRVRLPVAAIREDLHWQTFNSTIDIDIEVFADFIRERRRHPRKH